MARPNPNERWLRERCNEAAEIAPFPRCLARGLAALCCGLSSGYVIRLRVLSSLKTLIDFRACCYVLLSCGPLRRPLGGWNWRREDGGLPAGKVRLLTTADLDRRTKATQVALETRDSIMSDLGGEDQLSTLERLMVENAAFSSTVLRDAHVRWLKGEPAPVTELATLENTFNRTAQALGLARRAKDVTPDLSQYLDGKAGKGADSDE